MCILQVMHLPKSLHLSTVFTNTHACAHTHTIDWPDSTRKLAVIVIICDIHNIQWVCVTFGSTLLRGLSVIHRLASWSQRTTTFLCDATCRQLSSDALRRPWNPKSPAHLHWRLVWQAHNSKSSLGLNSTYQLSITPALDLRQFFTATLPDRQKFQHRESFWGS